jgi:hypothetical protein
MPGTPDVLFAIVRPPTQTVDRLSTGMTAVVRLYSHHPFASLSRVTEHAEATKQFQAFLSVFSDPVVNSNPLIVHSPPSLPHSDHYPSYWDAF